MSISNILYHSNDEMYKSFSWNAGGGMNLVGKYIIVGGIVHIKFNMMTIEAPGEGIINVNWDEGTLPVEIRPRTHIDHTVVINNGSIRTGLLEIGSNGSMRCTDISHITTNNNAVAENVRFVNGATIRTATISYSII